MHILYLLLIALAIGFIYSHFENRGRIKIKKMIAKNDHPERLSREVYLGNSYPGEYWKINLQTKRTGYASYNKDGEIIDYFPKIYPVFAKQEEVEKVFKKTISAIASLLDKVNPLINKEDLIKRALEMNIGDSFTFTPGKGVDNWMSREFTEGEINHEMWEKSLNREVSIFPLKNDGAIMKITCHQITTFR